MIKSKKTIFAAALLAVFTLGAGAESGESVLEETSLDGGLVIVLGCESPELLSALRPNDAYVVQGLDTNPDKVSSARKAIQKKGAYGPVSVDLLESAALPYVDNIVNLLVVADDLGIAEGEMKRVLRPGGKRVTLDSGRPMSDTFTKPLPNAIDEWTHYLYGPDNNAVASDSVVAPPRRLQWKAGPEYSRHHDHLSSINAMVTANGRIFTMIDEGPAWDIQMPPDWQLTARDAFNGKLLWKRPLGKWQDHMFRLKSGPALLPRRLVAVQNEVLAVLGLERPVSILDAATGETKFTLEGTDGAREIIASDETIYVVGPARDVKQWYSQGVSPLLAYSRQDGRRLWSRDFHVTPGTLAYNNGFIYFLDSDKVVCLKGDTGESVWASEPLPKRHWYPSFYIPILIATDRVILILPGETRQRIRWSSKGAKDTLFALNAENGKTLWKTQHPDTGYASPEDVLVINDKVWFTETRDGREPGFTYALDLLTGKLDKKFPPSRDIYWFHHRCHRAKATVNYLLTSRTGIEFIDLKQETINVNHWVRGACLFGILPANGLVYAPQHPCACYLETKLSGMNALAPAASKPRLPKTLPKRLTKGAAFDSPFVSRSFTKEDWPVYRHDSARSGASDSSIAQIPKLSFQIDCGANITPPVCADNLLLVAAPEQHRILAFQAKNGKPAWTFTAGGRIDSPPTIYGNRVFFGCRDGHVYCLDAPNGDLVWKYRAAPLNQQTMVEEQLESVWPVHGSVLVRDHTVYAVAGRSVFLDGGLRILMLNAADGSKLNETVLDGYKKEFGGKEFQDYVSYLDIPAGKPDILSYVNGTIYMRSLRIKPDGTLYPLKKKKYNGNAKIGFWDHPQNIADAHLFAPTGFLDDSGWHRTYWLYGSAFYSGWNQYFQAGKKAPAGKILVMNDQCVYGYGRTPGYWRWTTDMKFQIFKSRRDVAGKMRLNANHKLPEGRKRYGPNDYEWRMEEPPLIVRAMTCGSKRLVVAGPAAVQGDRQVAHWNGRHGGKMMIVNKENPEEKETINIPAPPVFDGLIVANRGVFISCIDGRILFYK